MFDQFAREVLYLIKKTTRELLPEETSEMFLARTKARDADLTAELWRSRVCEQKDLLNHVCHMLEKNYENCKKSWQTNVT